MNSLFAMMIWLAASLGIPGFECDPEVTETCEAIDTQPDGVAGPPPNSNNSQQYSPVFRIYNGF